MDAALLPTLLGQADLAEVRTFYPYTRDHYLALLVTAVVTVGLSWLGVKWRGTSRGQTLHRAWLIVVVLVQVLSLYYYIWHRGFDWEHSLPLEICDLAGMVAVVSLATGRRTPRLILYYWAFALTTNAFVTPILRQGPESLRYYAFWVTHLVILATAVYDVVVHRFRPKAWDFAMITLVMCLYGAVVIPLDVIMGYNYGFVGNAQPDTPTAVDILGPWPLRLVWMFLVVHGLFALLTVVWMVPWKRLTGRAAA
jgi:hypothetical integral membrane protein (TIGR02206 family)